MSTLRYRQIHLDFHTSGAIEGVGTAFDRDQFQRALQSGHVNSVTCFATCHHGWSYYDTNAGCRHPHLGFDLLRAQFDACKDIGVNIPVYLTAGVHNRIADEHPEWREMGCDGAYLGWTAEVLKPGFKTLCFNTPYLDHLCEQIEEVVTLFPEADGIFLDIISQSPCCCRWCMRSMLRDGFNPEKEEDRLAHAREVLKIYYQRATAAARRHNPDMPIFHNSGHVRCGDREVLKHFSHLELESLPTGGWGYDHFPVSAKYCHNLSLDFLGMTGKFHTTWGEFGGYKHPDALRYECAAMLAYGSKCSIGDQLHPSGAMDLSTYKLIGAAYAEVESKEPWCNEARNVADIGLLSSAAINQCGRNHEEDVPADVGAGRILLEGHFLFDVLDGDMEFSRYKMLILPDDIRVGPELKNKLDTYLAAGGRLLMTGESGLTENGSEFLFDLGAELYGPNEFQPDYILPRPELRPDFVDAPMVMYLSCQQVKVTTGHSIGDVYNPYFNRSYRHFCSHQHAPHRPEPSGFDCGVRHGNILYLSHPVFSIYRGFGAVACKEYIINAIRSLLGEPTVEVGLPSTGRVTLMEQQENGRFILHLLHAGTVQRGGPLNINGEGVFNTVNGVEVIDELLPLHDIPVSVSLPQPVQNVRCVPEGDVLAFNQKEGRVTFTLPRLECHQMIELQC